MVRYPQDMVQLKYVVRRTLVCPGENIETKTLQYRVKNVSIVDYTETWTEWTDVPTEYIEE